MEIGTVKIFLSSREAPHISDSLLYNRHECSKIDLDTNSFVKRDVEKVIRRRVGTWGWDVDLSERAIEALLAKSEGTFLWASLAMENLACFSSGPDFGAILEKPIPELQDLYRKMLRSLTEGEEPKKVLDIIRNVALALRPLTFGELGHILNLMEEKVSTERPTYCGPSSESRLRTEKEIRTYPKSSMGFLRATAETVSIVHHTAIEFFFDENREDELPILSKREVDLIISWECFRYLHHAFGDPELFQSGSVSGRQNGSQDSRVGKDHQEEEQGETLWEEEEQGETPWEVARKDQREAIAKWPFLRYAAESWHTHARRSIETRTYDFRDDSTRNWLQYQFFEASDAIRKPWIELCGDPRMEVLAGEQTPLHIAACLGLMPLVEKVLSGSTEGTLAQNSAPPVAHSSKINKKNGFGNTPLHLAFQFNHMMIVEFLLRKGAGPTIKNKAQLTPSELGGDLGTGGSLKEAVNVAAEGPVKGLV